MADRVEIKSSLTDIVLDDYKVVKVHECEKEDFDIQNENTMLIVIMLSLKHTSENQNKPFKTYIPKADSNRNQRYRLGNQSSTYERYVQFGDINSNGSVCSILTNSHNETSKLFKYVAENIAVGQCYAILEPSKITRLMSEEDNYVIFTSNPLIPLKRDTVKIPTRIWSKNLDPGKTEWFHLTKKRIKVFQVIPINGCCTGEFCDRQKQIQRNAKCGCIHTGRFSDLTLKMTVAVYEGEVVNNDNRSNNQLSVNGAPAGRQEEEYKVQMKVVGFTSFRVTKLFMKNIGMSNSIEALSWKKKIREKINEMVEIINKDGWDICGWLRCGKTVDASSTIGNEIDIASLGQLHHISYLWPSNHTSLQSIFDKKIDVKAILEE